MSRIWALVLGNHQLLLPTLVSNWDTALCFGQLFPAGPWTPWVLVGTFWAKSFNTHLKSEAEGTFLCLEATSTSGHTLPTAAGCAQEHFEPGLNDGPVKLCKVSSCSLMPSNMVMVSWWGLDILVWQRRKYMPAACPLPWAGMSWQRWEAFGSASTSSEHLGNSRCESACTLPR